MIKIENATYEYKSLLDDSLSKAVDNINIEVSKGEFLVILGHNGSGKSTLAKLINGLILPTEGNITVMGMNTKEEDNIWKIREKSSEEINGYRL